VSLGTLAYDLSNTTFRNQEGRMKFVEVCALQDIPPGTSRAVRACAVDVALFNMEGSVHAIENSCLHAGAALAGGTLCGTTVTCPAHGWRYDVTTGALLVAPGLRVRKFPVKVVDDKVMVEVEP
jgi:nitrite reductase/ring-hydroxylating ferredoxin subunit